MGTFQDQNRINKELVNLIYTCGVNLSVVHCITTLQHKGYSGSDGTMVGDRYTRLAPLARLSPLCPYSGLAVLREVGEVVYSQAENKMNISTRVKTQGRRGEGGQGRGLTITRRECGTFEVA